MHNNRQQQQQQQEQQKQQWQKCSNDSGNDNRGSFSLANNWLQAKKDFHLVFMVLRAKQNVVSYYLFAYCHTKHFLGYDANFEKNSSKMQYKPGKRRSAVFSTVDHFQAYLETFLCTLFFSYLLIFCFHWCCFSFVSPQNPKLFFPLWPQYNRFHYSTANNSHVLCNCCTEIQKMMRKKGNKANIVIAYIRVCMCVLVSERKKTEFG